MKIKVRKGVEVKKAKNGNGLFATKGFKLGTRIFQIRGKLVTCYEDEDIDETTRANTIRYDDELYISPEGYPSNYMNHSCEPNTRIVKIGDKLFAVTVSEVKKGEEIVFDYSTIIASDDSWTMKCKCGSSSCRGIVGQFKKLPKKLKEKYLALDMVPKYIQEVL
ncbi:MAG: SET domain-containing protein-lysine N-methyltransferase [Patescibacteria group bacterium]